MVILYLWTLLNDLWKKKSMSLPIQWTPIALQSLSKVFDYTFEEFGEKQLRILSDKITTTANRIATFPQIGKVEESLSRRLNIEYRSISVIHEINLIYTIHNDVLFIEYVKNNRQDDATILSYLTSYISQDNG